MGAVTRVLWFVSCAAGVVGLQVAVLSPGTVRSPSLLLANWWWVASFAAAAALVGTGWGAGVAGLGLGGVIAVALDRHLLVTGGVYWSPGFVGLFAGGIVTAGLMADAGRPGLARGSRRGTAQRPGSRAGAAVAAREGDEPAPDGEA